MKLMSLPVLVALGLGLVAGIPATQAQAQKIGIFDAQKITAETAEGAKIQARLTGLQEKKRGELKKLQEELEAMQKEFVQTAASASQDKQKEMQLRIQRKQDELESAQKAANRELQMEMEAAQEGWQRRIMGIIENYGKQNGFSLILPSDVAIFYASSIDITADIVKLVDSSPAPAAAPAPAGKPAPAPPKK